MGLYTLLSASLFSRRLWIQISQNEYFNSLEIKNQFLIWWQCLDGDVWGESDTMCVDVWGCVPAQYHVQSPVSVSIHSDQCWPQSRAGSGRVSCDTLLHTESPCIMTSITHSLWTVSAGAVWTVAAILAVASSTLQQSSGLTVWAELSERKFNIRQCFLHLKPSKWSIPDMSRS